MITIPGKIPIRIHPLFWLLVAWIGWMSSNTLLGTALWVSVIFFSILFHEFGHALTALAFGQTARIDLVVTGGLTQRSGPTLKLWQEFLVVLNGPLAGFCLYGLALMMSQTISLEQRPIAATLLQMALFINFYWTIINLLPIQPLDGGHLLSVFMEMVLGVRGVKIAFFISMVVAGALAGYFFYANNLLAGSILFLFMFESYRSWKSSLLITDQDQKSELQEMLKEAEIAYQSGHLAEAQATLEQIRHTTISGSLYTRATIYLANIFGNQHKDVEALSLLEPLKTKLPLEGRMLLLQLYYKTGRLQEAIAIGHPLYQERGGFDVALINAYCHAQLGDPRAAVGWLQCAIREGLPDVKSCLAGKEFDRIRQDAGFQELSVKS